MFNHLIVYCFSRFPLGCNHVRIIWSTDVTGCLLLFSDETELNGNASGLLKSCEDLLECLQLNWAQFQLDGVRDIWILKPGAKSRGRGGHPYFMCLVLSPRPSAYLPIDSLLLFVWACFCVCAQFSSCNAFVFIFVCYLGHRLLIWGHP